MPTCSTFPLAPEGLPFPPHPVARPARVESAVYRPFFAAGVAVALTLGVGWGAWLLWRIGVAGSFTGVSIHAVNAHGLAQVYGWVGLFVMGFAYQFFPRLWHAPLARPRLARAVLALQLAGLTAASLALGAAGRWPAARGVALAGGGLLALAAALFAGQMVATFRAGTQRLEPSVAFVFAGFGWFFLSTLASAGHAWLTMGATTREALVHAVGTYQAPLRDLQVHGLALFMILGVSLKLMPSILGVPRPRARAGWWAFGILLASVALEAGVFLAYRFSGRHELAALLLLPWIGLAAGAALVVVPLRPWRTPHDRDRSAKFIRAAYGWLFVSLAMLLLLPVYQLASGLPFSHAYYGATRHAITVGFVSLMIMGMAARFVAALNGRDRFALPSQTGPFVLVNAGCLLRVVLQTLTDWHPAFFPLVGVSALLELAGFAWWGAHLVSLMRPRSAPSPRALPSR